MRETTPALTSRLPLAVIYPRPAHERGVQAIAVHAVTELGAQRIHTRGPELRGLALLAHAIDLGPEALLEPADLAEDFLAAGHFLFAVARGSDVCEFVDEGARRVDEFVERRRRPVGDEGLVESYNVRVGAGRGQS